MNVSDLEASWPWAATSQGRGMQRHRLEGIAEYLHIGGPGLSSELAAERLGVHVRTVQRWRAAIERVRAS